MSETGTIEEVRAEIRTVEERLEAFERLVSALENDQVLLGASATTDALATAIPELQVMAEAGDRRAEQAGEDAAGLQYLTQEFLTEFVEGKRLILVLLRRGLIPALWNRRYALLAALEPPSEVEVNLLERVVQAARNALSFGHPA